MLTSLLWGESDPARLPFLDPPPAPAMAEARQRLERLGAIDGDGHITAHGRAIAAIPLEPRLAHMLIEAGERGFAGAAAEAAALLTERGLGGNDPDLELRHRRWVSDRSPRAQAARAAGGAVGQGERRATDRARMILRGPLHSPFPTGCRGGAMPPASSGNRSADAVSGSIPPRRLRVASG